MQTTYNILVKSPGHAPEKGSHQLVLPSVTSIPQPSIVHEIMQS